MNFIIANTGSGSGGSSLNTTHTSDAYLNLAAVEVLANVLLDLDEAHLALGVPAPLVLLLPRRVAPLELAPADRPSSFHSCLPDLASQCLHMWESPFSSADIHIYGLWKFFLKREGDFLCSKRDGEGAASLLVRAMPFSKEPTRAVQAAHGGSRADFLSSFFTF